MTISSPGKDVKQLELSSLADGNAEWHNHFGKIVGQFLVKLDMHLPYNLPILLGIYPSEMKTYVYTHTKTASDVYTSSIVMAPNWKQTKCPAPSE